ncbi:hypothetical protein ACLKA6_002074 [Drosophila palustris]
MLSPLLSLLRSSRRCIDFLTLTTRRVAATSLSLPLFLCGGSLAGWLFFFCGVETFGKGIKVAHSLAHQPLRVVQLKC